MTVANDIFALFAAHGSAAYGEDVTCAQHSLQTAYFARVAAVPTSLVLAALLHDIGHLIAAVPDDLAEWQADAHHEEVGARWLAAHFGPAIVQPVRLHVAAKRYLCAVDPGYFGTLSPASLYTLKLQGGPMSPSEAAQFEREPYHADAVALRHWDDGGKVAGLAIPPLESYRHAIECSTTWSST
jgi:gamma-butyrobetaine dioxygenase